MRKQLQKEPTIQGIQPRVRQSQKQAKLRDDNEASNPVALAKMKQRAGMNGPSGSGPVRQAPSSRRSSQAPIKCSTPPSAGPLPEAGGSLDLLILRATTTNKAPKQAKPAGHRDTLAKSQDTAGGARLNDYLNAQNAGENTWCNRPASSEDGADAASFLSTPGSSLKSLCDDDAASPAASALSPLLQQRASQLDSPTGTLDSLVAQRDSLSGGSYRNAESPQAGDEAGVI